MTENLRWFWYMIRRRYILFQEIVYDEWEGVELTPRLAWSIAGTIWYYSDELGRKMWKRRGEK